MLSYSWAHSQLNNCNLRLISLVLISTFSHLLQPTYCQLFNQVNWWELLMLFLLFRTCISCATFSPAATLSQCGKSLRRHWRPAQDHVQRWELNNFNLLSLFCQCQSLHLHKDATYLVTRAVDPHSFLTDSHQCLSLWIQNQLLAMFPF